jgi:hypothetical protein
MESPTPTSASSPLLQPLLTASLSISCHSYEREQNADWLEPLLSFKLMGRLSPFTGILFLCGSHAYTFLPTNWMGVCTLVFLIPPCLLHYWLRHHSCQLYKHKKRYWPHSPSSGLGLGLLTGIGTGAAGLRGINKSIPKTIHSSKRKPSWHCLTDFCNPGSDQLVSSGGPTKQEGIRSPHSWKRPAMPLLRGVLLFLYQ